MINSIKTIIQILIYTGMRVSEVCNLKKENIDLENNLFYIEVAKNDNKRIVPFSENLKLKIINYFKKSNQYLEDHNKVFYSININKEIMDISNSQVYWYFRKAIKSIGITHKKGVGPRVHDFRHTAAIMILKQLIQNESDINGSLAYLSTYLGHKTFNETQRYIWLIPELMNPTLEKMENYSSFINEMFKDGDYFE